MIRRILLLLVLASMPMFAVGADWPQFRGPNMNGVATEKLPAEWSAEKNLAWTAAVPGVAWSCPIVVGEKVFLTSAVAPNQPKPLSRFGGGRVAPDVVYQYQVICLDRATGKKLWEQTAVEGKPRMPTHASNTFASETPVADAERVYAYFGNTGLFCYDLAGKQLWKHDLGAFPMMNGWGTSSSPVLHDGKVFIQCDNEQESFIVAYDAKTGKEVWRQSRKEKSSWSTPYLWTTKSRTDVVAIGAERVIGYHPADGKIVWELTIGGGGQCSASPVADGEQLYVGTGMGRGRSGAGNAGTLYAVKAGATGDITPKAGEMSSTSVAWMVPKVWPAAASPLAYQGNVYLLDRNGGFLSCFDAATGKARYTKERIPNAKAFWASPWGDDGKIYCLDEDGQTHVVKAGTAFEVVRVNTLPKELYWSTPASADGAIFIRGVDHLYCVKPASAP